MRGNYTNDVSHHVKALNAICQNDVHFNFEKILPECQFFNS